MKKNSVKIIKTVISLVLSFININLAASLEPWTKTCGKITLVLFYGIGFVLCFLLTVYLLLQSKRRLKIHSLLWGIPLAAAYVLGCLMRRDGTALGSLSHLPVLLLQILCLAVLAGACIAPLLWGFLKPECWLTQLRSYFTCWYDAGNQAGSGTSADIAAQGHKDQSVSHLKLSSKVMLFLQTEHNSTECLYTHHLVGRRLLQTDGQPALHSQFQTNGNQIERQCL